MSPSRLSIIAALAVGLGALGLATQAPAAPEKKPVQRDQSKLFDELTPSEHIAIRAAAKAAYKDKKLRVLNVCADPGNMPLSNIKREGFQNKLAQLLADATGARLNYYWQPFIERGLTRATFDEHMCDVMFDVPATYGRLLTTFPVYKTPYVLVYRSDKGIEIKDLDDPKLKDLTIGVFQTSGIRAALAKRGVIDNVKLQLQTHDGDLVPENQPWYVVQRMLNGEFDVAAVFGPFAGWVKTMKGEPITILPVNLMDDRTPLEFELALGVRQTDAFLKYLLEFALEDHEAEVEKILRDFGVPLVQCSRCVVAGDLPAHGSYIQPQQTDFKARPDLASPDQVGHQGEARRLARRGRRPQSGAVQCCDRVGCRPHQAPCREGRRGERARSARLDAAAERGAPEERQAGEGLIELGADPNRADNSGMTPLVAAVMRDHVPSVRALLENGADIEQLGPQGYRPLALAIAESKYEAAKALMEGGADVSVASGHEGLTPLMIVAAQTGPAEGAMFLPGSTRPTDIAKGLIERKATIDAQSNDGMTALMVAAAHNSPPMIGLLMDAGADPDIKNKRGQTARDVAELNGNLEASQAILVLSNARSAKAPEGAAEESTSQ